MWEGDQVVLSLFLGAPYSPVGILMGPLSGIWAGRVGGSVLPCVEGRPWAGAPKTSLTFILPTSLEGALFCFIEERHLWFIAFQ